MNDLILQVHNLQVCSSPTVETLQPVINKTNWSLVVGNFLWSVPAHVYWLLLIIGCVAGCIMYIKSAIWIPALKVFWVSSSTFLSGSITYTNKLFQNYLSSVPKDSIVNYTDTSCGSNGEFIVRVVSKDTGGLRQGVYVKYDTWANFETFESFMLTFKDGITKGIMRDISTNAPIIPNTSSATETVVSSLVEKSIPDVVEIVAPSLIEKVNCTLTEKAADVITSPFSDPAAQLLGGDFNFPNSFFGGN